MTYGFGKQVKPHDALFILTGAQRGATVELDALPLRLGADSQSDILLLRDEVGEHGVHLHDAVGGFIRMEVQNGSAVVGGRTIKSGSVRKVGRSATISLGSTVFMIASSLAEADRMRRNAERRTRRMSWAASLAVILGASGAFALAATQQKEPDEPRISAERDAKTGEAVMPVLAAASLRSRLADAGLGRLEVNADRTTGIVTVAGALRADQRADWNAVQKWFDATYGMSVQLEARISEAANTVTLPFSVQSVWAGSSPRITLHDGSRSRIGDVLPGGWRLDAIQPGSIEISRDGENLVLSL